MIGQQNMGGFHLKDLGEIAIGACVMAFPVATTEEVWGLGGTLPLGRVMLFAVASLLFLGFFIHLAHHQSAGRKGWLEFFKRLLSTYWVTFLICALLLLGLGKLPLLTDPIVGLKTTILVAFPASFAATVVDGMK